MSDFDYIITDDYGIEPLPDIILVHNIQHGEYKTSGGIIIPDDNGKESGIKPRFCTVFAVGKNISYLKVGDVILVSHGRWSRGVKIKNKDGSSTVIRRVDPNDILVVKED